MQCPGYPKVWSFADDLSKWHPVSTEAWRWEAGLNQNLNVSVVCTTSFLCIASMLGCDTMNFQQTCSRHTVGSWVPRQGVVCAWRLNQTVWNRWIEQPPHTTEPTGKGAAGEWLPLARGWAESFWGSLCVPVFGNEHGTLWLCFPRSEVERLQAMPSLSGGWDQVLRLWDKEDKWLMLLCFGSWMSCYLSVSWCACPLLLVGIWYHVSVLSSLKTMCI